jgi:hypothetical protein
MTYLLLMMTPAVVASCDVSTVGHGADSRLKYR